MKRGLNDVYLNKAWLNVCSLNANGLASGKSKLISVCTSGSDVIEIDDANKGSVSSLTLRGFTSVGSKSVVCNNGKIVGIDKELPQGYARLTGIVMNDDTYYLIDGFRLKGSDTLKVSFTASKACNVVGCYTTTDAEDNYSIFASTTANAKYLRYNGGTYLSAITANVRYDVIVTPTGATGFDKTSTWKEADFTSSVDMLIGSTSVNATSAKMTGTIHGVVEVEGRAKFIPCKRLSDGAIGYYDTYAAKFYAPAVGSPVAEGYDSSQISIVKGNAPESVIVEAVYDKRLPNGYTPIEYVEGDGSTNYVDTGIVIDCLNADVVCDFQMTGNAASTPEMIWGYMDGASNIPRWGFGEYTTKWLGSPNNTTSVGTSDLDRHTCTLSVFTENGTAYYDGTLDNESLYNKSQLASAQAFEENTLSIYLFARNNKGVAGNFGICRIYSFVVTKNGEVAHELIPCKNDKGVVGFYDVRGKSFLTCSNGALIGGEPANGVVCSASSESLYSVGNYVDEQDVVSGSVTRRLGVLVLDGTEKWTKATNSSSDGNAVFYVTVNERANNDTSLKLLSSHYSFRGTVSYSTLKSGEMSITQTTRNVYFDGGNCTSVDEWKAYLAEQYASGTPVVVVYPLAEENKESVKSQPMMLADGHNTIRRESSVSGLEMTCCYKQKPKEEEGGSLIKFTVDEVECQTEEGMTWEQYCGSKYNTLGCFLVDGDDTVYTQYENNGRWDYQYEFIMYNGTSVSRSDIIIPNALYSLFYDAGIGGWG